MRQDTVVRFRKKDEMLDPLTVLLRCGARELIGQAVSEEFEMFLERHAQRRDLQGRQAMVRNGYLLEREALAALVDKEAAGLSAAVVSRLKARWTEEYEAWKRAPLGKDRWVYQRADGIYSGLRADDQRLCLLVVIGVNERGEKRFLAIEDGVRESAEHWIHIRTANPIESSFTTVRHRTDRTKGCVSRSSLLGLTYELAMSAEKSWHRLRGFERLGDDQADKESRLILFTHLLTRPQTESI